MYDLLCILIFKSKSPHILYRKKLGEIVVFGKDRFISYRLEKGKKTSNDGNVFAHRPALAVPSEQKKGGNDWQGRLRSK